MSETILAVIITGVCGVVGSYISARSVIEKKSREDAIKDAQREQRQSDRLEAIERKLDIHNGYAEKLGSIQNDITAIHKDIEYLKGGTR